LEILKTESHPNKVVFIAEDTPPTGEHHA
jgi:hypothetical protein